MLKIPIEEIISKINEKTGLSPESIDKKITEKVNELSGLVSREGAAHIVANEFGVQLFHQQSSGRLQIKNIIPGLRSVSFMARVIKIYPVKDFKTDKREGKIGSFLVGDETGKMRVVLWDVNQIKLLEDGTISEGDIIKISSCYVKEGFRGGVEVHASSRSHFNTDVDSDEAKKIPPLEELQSDFQTQAPSAQRVKIKDIDEGFKEIRGAIVSIIDGTNFYEVCPACNKKVYDGRCNEHGEVDPKQSLIISALIDDGTDNMRIVFFREQAEQLLGMSSEKAYEAGQEAGDESFAIKESKNNLLGKEIIIEGNIAKNNYSGELEMIVRSIKYPDPKTEAEKLV